MLKIIANVKFEEHQSKNKNNQVIIEWNEVLTIRQADGRIHRRPARKHEITH